VGASFLTPPPRIPLNQTLALNPSPNPYAYKTKP
jgi:hypothetical protein